MAEHEDPRGVHRRPAPEQLDGRDRVVDVLVFEREAGILGDHTAVDVRDLVEAQYGDAPVGEPPREVLERLVPPDRLVAVSRPRTGEQHHGGVRSRPAWQGEGARHRERSGADRHVLLVEGPGVGVRRWHPRLDRLGGTGGRELEPGQPAGVVDRDDHRQLALLERHGDLDHDRPRPGRLAHRRADGGDRALPAELGRPGELERLGRHQRP